MKNKPENSINPMLPENWNKPLWFVYGDECFPQVLCAMLKMSGGLTIWGYSVFRRQGGFRTLGTPAGPWLGATQAVAFAEQQHMLDYLKKITTPKGTQK